MHHLVAGSTPWQAFAICWVQASTLPLRAVFPRVSGSIEKRERQQAGLRSHNPSCRLLLLQEPFMQQGNIIIAPLKPPVTRCRWPPQPGH